MDIRIGNGFDVHAFEEGNFVILGELKFLTPLSSADTRTQMCYCMR